MGCISKPGVILYQHSAISEFAYNLTHSVSGRKTEIPHIHHFQFLRKRITVNTDLLFLRYIRKQNIVYRHFLPNRQIGDILFGIIVQIQIAAIMDVRTLLGGQNGDAPVRNQEPAIRQP